MRYAAMVRARLLQVGLRTVSRYEWPIWSSRSFSITQGPMNRAISRSLSEAKRCESQVAEDPERVKERKQLL